ncbi:folliculin-interacting protein 2 isoform X2 [Galleria mellonella]|uniref:Folliculin-interacting protein 2 isoform X2 n=1 Tax=Galleria mellonella TaxID=7137 RepID=A0ABM3MGI4_GALME|nr:folliculin-interacting protein 2 isoform X2 [Galleria mellonella]
MKFRCSQINKEQVRLLLFKECDWRGRKLLFDSSSIDKVPAGKNDKPNIRKASDAPCIVEVSEGFAYVYKGPAADAKVLGEMIFGAVAMNCKSVSLKIHIMDEPRRLMCTKVFCVPTSRRISRTERKTESSTAKVRNSSMPLNVPLLKEEGVSLSFSIDRGDSGFYGDHSPRSSVDSTYDYVSMFDIWDGNNTQEEFYTFYSPPGRKLSTSSNGSWQRRTFQNLVTRFDLGQESSNLLNVPTATSHATSSDSQIYSSSSASGTSDSLASVGSSTVQRKNKLGLALLFTVTDATEMDLLRRCAEHSPQLQALVCRLRLATLNAGSGGGFVSTLHRAAIDAARWLTDLMHGPRLQPVWLSLVTSDSRTANKTADTLLSDLCSVLSMADTKHTNFFISTLLTHVLTYHLGWVTTVSPYDTVDLQTQLSRSSEPRRCYNALWAQLNDLCGSIGFPPRAARTIISGTTNSQFVKRLLIVLTYFVRCGDVKRNEFQFDSCVLDECKVVSVNAESLDSTKDTSQVDKLGENVSKDSLKVPSVNTQNSDSSVSTLVASQTSIKRSSTLANIGQKLSTSLDFAAEDCSSTSVKTTSGVLRRNPTMLMSLRASSDSSLNSSNPEEPEVDEKVVFVLGEDEQLVGLKNKSSDGKSVKKSSKVHNEPINLEIDEKEEVNAKDSSKYEKDTESPSKCCGQTFQNSKPIKHSGFKFEFDKYPQIVTNYMKSKNLEILDRHYIGKPGNLKLDNFQFDPTIVPPIQEERCETCYKCQLMESMLQTPTNASEMEYMNDIPRQSEPQFAKETVVNDVDTRSEVPPVNYVRKRVENTLVVNPVDTKNVCEEKQEVKKITRVKEKDKVSEVKRVIEFPLPSVRLRSQPDRSRAGFDASLLGGVTDHYVPDLILQGTITKSNTWETELRRDLDLTAYLNKIKESPLQTVAIIGDISKWEVRVVGRECGTGGMSSLVGAMLDALPAMHRARVPAHQCLTFLEGKLREFCVLSKTLADMLMSTDFCDIATLTKSLNIDVNDVPLLLAVATTHTPQVAARYGVSYR